MRIVRTLAFVALVGCTPAPAPPPEAAELPLVKAAEVGERVFGDALELAATLEAKQVATLVPSLPVPVRTVNVRIGDRVAKGDVLVTLEADKFSQGLKQAQATVEIARAQIEQAHTNARRFEALSAESAVTPAEYEQVQTALTMARAQLSQAEAGVEVAQEQLSDTELRAPFDGLIIARNLEPGEMATGGAMAGPPLRIADMSALRVVAEIGELHAGRISAGQQVQVRVDALPDETFTAIIERVNPAVDPRSRTVRLEALLEAPDPRLSHGMAGTLSVEGGGVPRLGVPRQALLDRDDGTARVLVLQGDLAVERSIRYGRSTDEFVPVLSGLEAGERVLVAGHTRLMNEQRVALVEAD